jgi:hypothetical protein
VSAGPRDIRVSRHTGSPNTDYPAALLNIYCFYLAIRLCELWAFDHENRAELQSHFAVLIVVATLALTLKLSQAPLLLLPLIFFVAMVIGRLPRVSVLPTLVFAAIVCTLWGLRNIALSGCIAYPQPVLCFYDLPWAETAIRRCSFIVWRNNFSRAPGVPLASLENNWDWVPDWFANVYSYKLVWLPQLLCLGALRCSRFAARLAAARGEPALSPYCSLACSSQARWQAWRFWFFCSSRHPLCVRESDLGALSDTRLVPCPGGDRSSIRRQLDAGSNLRQPYVCTRGVSPTEYGCLRNHGTMAAVACGGRR